VLSRKSIVPIKKMSVKGGGRLGCKGEEGLAGSGMV